MDGGLEGLDAVAGRATDVDDEPFRLGGQDQARREISLVQDEDAVDPGELRQVSAVHVGQGFRAVEHMEQEFGACGRRARAADALFLQKIPGVAQPGGVHENDGDAADVGGFLDRVPGVPAMGETMARSCPSS